MENETLSVSRSECKYFVTKAASAEIRSKFDQLLQRDKHSQMSSYMVRSLYFDTINDMDYMTKMAGTEVRKKIRMRVYSAESEKCKLEVKQKNGNFQRKVSLWITREDAYQLIHLNYSILVKYFSEHPDSVYIYSLFVTGVYRPVVMVEYDRIAYTYPLYNTRIAFDMNLRSSESNFDLFDERPIYTTLITENDVLEVKYNEKLVRFISDILKPYKLIQGSISKYCLGRKIFADFNF